MKTTLVVLIQDFITSNAGAWLNTATLWRIGTLKYLEIKIEEWPSKAKRGQSGPNGAKWCQIVPNRAKCGQMGSNGAIWGQSGLNGKQGKTEPDMA